MKWKGGIEFFILKFFEREGERRRNREKEKKKRKRKRDEIERKNC